MLLVLMMLAGLWLLGWALGKSHVVRLRAMAAVWLLAGLEFTLARPQFIGMRGANLRVWAAMTVVFALTVAYLWGLGRLRRRAVAATRVSSIAAAMGRPEQAARTAPSEMMQSMVAETTPAAAETKAPAVPRTGRFSGEELDRYARHIMLREIGGPGQKKLREATVLVVGAGGLGSPALLYLAAAGVGRLVVVDNDEVDASNLQRQVIHTTAQIGAAKVDSARAAIAALNPNVAVDAHRLRLGESNAEKLISGVDLVLDGSDNFDTRYLVNRVAARLGKPLISAAITQWEGQLSLYDPAHGTPCYECVFPTRPAPGMVPSCAEAGVVAPLPGVLGAMMATEAIKHLTGAGETLHGRLMVHDALYAETRVFQISRREDCPVCGESHRGETEGG